MPYYTRDGDGWELVLEEPPEELELDGDEQYLADRLTFLGSIYPSLDAPTLANSTDYRFIVRIFKRLASAPLKDWSNTYELKTPATTNITTVLATLYDLVQFERDFHLTTVEIFKAIVSTWKPDGAVYNPYSFAVFDLDSPGQRPTGGNEPEPLDATLYASRNAGLGHNGKAWYRGCLLESDKNSVAGDATLADGLIQARFVNAANLFISQYYYGGSSPIRLAMIGTDGTNVRYLENLTPTGIRFRQVDNIYFDKP